MGAHSDMFVLHYFWKKVYFIYLIIYFDCLWDNMNVVQRAPELSVYVSLLLSLCILFFILWPYIPRSNFRARMSKNILFPYQLHGCSDLKSETKKLNAIKIKETHKSIRNNESKFSIYFIFLRFLRSNMFASH